MNRFKGLLTLFISAMTMCSLASCSEQHGIQGGTYTVTYDANGGVFSNGESTTVVPDVSYGERLAEPETPIRIQNGFEYWAIENDGRYTEFNFSTDYIKSDMTLYAVWNSVVAIESASDDCVIKADDVTQKETIEIRVHNSCESVYVDEYLSFSSNVHIDGDMYIDGVRNSKVSSPSAGSSEMHSVTITANGVSKDYSLKLKRAACVNICYRIDAARWREDTAETFFPYDVTANTPSKTGYDFAYWNCNDSIFMPGDSFIPEKDMFLNASFAAHDITITYMPNGGILTIDGKEYTDDNPYVNTIKYGENADLAGLKRNGFLFANWSMNKSGAENVNTLEWLVDSDTTIYACWTPIVYSITYILDGGVNNINNPVTYTTLDEIVLYPASKDRYTFSCWQDDSGRVVDKISTGMFADLTLIAIYSANSYVLTVKSENESKGTVTGSGTYAYGSLVTIEACPVGDGYSFAGWYIGETKVSSDLVYAFKMPYKDCTIVAKWVTVLFTVTTINADSSMGTLTGQGSYEYGSYVTLTATPNDGYTFAGWYSGDDLIESSSTYKFRMPCSNYTLTAAWAANYYTLSIANKSELQGSVFGNGTYAYGSLVTVSATPADGYVFIGWYEETSKLSSDASYTFNMPSHDYSLLAEFLSKEAAIAYGIVPGVTERTLTYGLYPQTHVSDPLLISSLNSLTDTNLAGYYLYNGDYYFKALSDPCDSLYEFDDGTSIESGVEYWFKCEPIEWTIISNVDGCYFAVASKLLDTHMYSWWYSSCGIISRQDYQGKIVTGYANNYRSSYQRTFLNVNFYNKAFSLNCDDIKITLVNNTALTTGGLSDKYICENVRDKVLALSYSEINNQSYFASDSDRRCETTDYARSVGAYSDEGYGRYWTRSPGSSDDGYAWCVGDDGNISEVLVNSSDVGIRPAICLEFTR